MTTTTIITTADDVAALLDGLVYALSDVPGRQPHDAQIARWLLAYTMTLGGSMQSSQMLLSALRAHGVDPAEAETIARALIAAALRMAAWLGRGR